MRIARGTGNASLGLAVSATAVWAADPRARAQLRPWSRVIEPLPAGDAQWPGLTEALRELRATHGGRGNSLAVALLPPLVELRPVELPPVTADEARLLLARHSARHFLGAREPQVIGLDVPARRNGGGARPVVAAAAPARALDAIYRAARDAGWEIQTVVPAEQAWRAAALELWPRLRRGTGHVVIAHAGRTDVLRLDDGTLTGARRFRALSSDLAQVYESIAGGDAPSASSAVAVLGDPAARVALARELSRGDALLPEPSTSIPAAESAELAAAAFASRGAGLELLPEQALRARRERMRGVTIAAAVAAGVLLALAAALELWGVQRELEQVRRERNALRPRVADVAVTRELATSTSRIVEDLASEEQSGTRWSDVIATVASALPRDAHLTALRVEGDSLTIEGLADRAANVFAAVERARGLDGVRSAAPVRRDFRDLEDQRERFSLAARAAPTAPRETDTITTAASRP